MPANVDETGWREWNRRGWLWVAVTACVTVVLVRLPRARRVGDDDARTVRLIILMAPYHHHFEKQGWSESTVVIRFWIVAVMLALVVLATLK